MQFVQFLYKKKTKFPVFSIQHLNFSVKRNKPKKISEKMNQHWKSCLKSSLKIVEIWKFLQISNKKFLKL